MLFSGLRAEILFVLCL